MGKYQSFILIALALLASHSVFGYSSKIDHALSKALERDDHANIVVSMKAGTRDVLNDLARMSFSSRTERSQAVYNALTARAQSSQIQILRYLSEPATLKAFNYGKIQKLWITNQIGIQFANRKLVETLASMDGISRIQEDEVVYLDEPIESETTNQTSVNAVNQWGIQIIEAPSAWSLYNGTNGAGITVAGIDTGVRHTHDVIRNNYKNDSHSWFDPFDGSEIPDDRNGHGTHITGTIAGVNGFGVAPGVEWIHCKGLDDNGSGPGTVLLACGQFMVCPTNASGEDADCSKTPHIVSNSWASGSGGVTFFDEMIAVWHAAGVIPVFASGNSGPNCGTARSPSDRDVIAVGSTNDLDALSTFSSVGPSVGVGAVKPDISAPGQIIMSADHRNDNSYRIMSGTSMACPHVAGAIALLLSRNPDLTYAQVKTLIQSHADRDVLTSSGSNCSWISDNVFPNHHFGYGRLNIHRALQALA